MLRVHLNGTHVREAAVSKGLEEVTSYVMPPPTDKSPQRDRTGDYFTNFQNSLFRL